MLPLCSASRTSYRTARWIREMTATSIARMRLVVMKIMPS